MKKKNNTNILVVSILFLILGIYLFTVQLVRKGPFFTNKRKYKKYSFDYMANAIGMIVIASVFVYGNGRHPPMNVLSYGLMIAGMISITGWVINRKYGDNSPIHSIYRGARYTDEYRIMALLPGILALLGGISWWIPAMRR